MKKLIIIPYFGKFSNYFDLYLYSISRNEDIDFLFFTDADVASYPSYRNIRFVKMSWKEMQLRIQSKFDFDVCIDKPYKLCDYKPCYGAIFDDYTAGYDFWGFGDTDLIMGRISAHLNDDIFKKYDRILHCGHLTFIRNCEEMNFFFKKQFNGFLNYQEVLSHPDSFRFDETGLGGTFDMMIAHCPDRIYTHIDYDDLWIPRRYYGFKNVNTEHLLFLHYRYSNGSLKRCYFSLKHLSFVEEETMYVHMQKRRMDIPQKIDNKDYWVFSDYFITKTSMGFCERLYRSRPKMIDNFVNKITKRLKNE